MKRYHGENAVMDFEVRHLLSYRPTDRVRPGVLLVKSILSK
jgi:hypothetical protein